MLVEISIKQEAVDLIKSTAFYFPERKNIDTGELYQNKTDWIRALSIALLIYKDCDINKGKKIGSRTFKDIKEDYKPLVDTLVDLSIINIIASASCGKATHFGINPDYIGKCNIELNEKELKIYEIAFRKQSNRGIKCTTDKRISVEIDKSEFFQLYAQNKILMKKKKHLAPDQMWEVICKINEKGTIDPHGRRESRIFSLITELSSFLHPYIKIDGENIVEFDQHATYWTLLPSFLEKNKSIIAHNEQILYFINQELDKFKLFMKNTNNIYESIAKLVNLPINIVKDTSMYFLCETITELKGNGKIIQNWFKSEYPYLNRILDDYRSDSRVSYRLQTIEQSLFVNASRKCKIIGIDTVTKHDALLCLEKDIEKVEEILKQQFLKKGVEYKCRIKNVGFTPDGRAESVDSKFSIVAPDNTGITQLYQGVGGEEQGIAIRVIPAKNDLLSGANQEKEGDSLFSYPVQNSLSGANQEFKIERSDAAQPKFKREKQSDIKNYRNGYRISIKNQYVYSKKNETLEQFKLRIGVTDMPIDKNFLEKVEESFKQPVEAFPSGVETVIDGKSDKEAPKKSEPLKSSIEWNEKYEFSSIFARLNEDEDE